MDINFIKTSSKIFPYNRKLAYLYAKKWSLDRNPIYYDFDGIGGDCTNFVSQVIHAGGCPMNYDKFSGWYYNNLSDRSPSWTSVNLLREFLLTNTNRGPIAKISNIDEIDIGDIIQLDFDYDNLFNHSLVIVDIKEPRIYSNISIAAHTYDRFNYSLDNYNFKEIEFYHILGYKK